METDANIEQELMPQKNCEARDEMNLAEFPLCSLAHRLNPEVKTLRFQDRVWDKGRNEWNTRKLTITGSDAHGLPTEKDDEVLLGLIQLTRMRGFTERKVVFTCHELIQMLGWRDDNKSYARIEKALSRWLDVAIHYDKAWWDKQEKCWMSPKFHFVESVCLCQRDKTGAGDNLSMKGAPASTLMWSEVIFRSFTHGNLKSIDFEFFKSLRSAVAKRLYRFLDKRFYHSNRFEMGLRELGCEHIGLSRTYDTANLKRKLLTGIRELEARGFLQPLTKEEQFNKVRAGEWRVAFARASAPLIDDVRVETQPNETLVHELVRRGVSVPAAQRAVVAFTTTRIRSQMEVFDWLVQRKDVKISRNPAGFLMSSITHDYVAPSAFVPTASERPKFTRCSGTKQKVKELRERAGQEQDERREQTIAEFWSALSQSERQVLEMRAFKEAKKFERELVEGGGPFAETARKAILDAFVWKQRELPVTKQTG